MAAAAAAVEICGFHYWRGESKRGMERIAETSLFIFFFVLVLGFVGELRLEKKHVDFGYIWDERVGGAEFMCV